MAGWIGLLKMVPWGEVVSNAPKIAEGAKSLWTTASKKLRPGEPRPDDGTEAEPPNDAQALRLRIGTLEAQQRELTAQLASASELIRSLADQNTQLVARLEKLRRQLRWLGAGLVLSVGLILAAVIMSPLLKP